ncbi:conserved hypothetical protein [Ricinus communis]|uniref:Uncharacterized protein n=1 Tax=Ricinus communis TaxID=3988 RepID=B9RNY8_RICCO|nr:conserved hypothetical protein [Ricinus communis]
MVIGKSKKDEKDPPSKATQPQVEVSVDVEVACFPPGHKVPTRSHIKNEYKAIAKIAALATTSEADSSEATLTREQKLKAERLRRAKMFAAIIKGGVAPVNSESLRGLSVEPSEFGFSGSDSQVVHLVGREREGSSAPMEVDTCNKIEKAEKKGLTE